MAAEQFTDPRAGRNACGNIESGAASKEALEWTAEPNSAIRLDSLCQGVLDNRQS